MSQEISVVVRVLPNNEDIDVNLPLDATASDVIETLLDNNIGQRSDTQGNPITYRLAPKGKNMSLAEDETLGDAGVQNGDILLMMPDFVAGGSPKNRMV